MAPQARSLLAFSKPTADWASTYAQFHVPRDAGADCQISGNTDISQYRNEHCGERERFSFAQPASTGRRLYSEVRTVAGS